MRCGKGESHGLGLHPFTGVLLLGASAGSLLKVERAVSVRLLEKKQCINKNKQTKSI